MAITQDRLITILSATRRAHNTIQTTQRFVAESLAALPRDPTLDEALSCLQALQTYFQSYHIRPDDAALLAAEETHFRLAYQRNKRTAERARRKRAGSPSGSIHMPAAIRGRDISDEEKEAIYAAAERIASMPVPDQLPERFGLASPTAPNSILRPLPLSQLTTQKPAPADFGLMPSGRAMPKPRPMTDEQLLATGAITQLTLDKIHCNSLAKQFNMREPYPDPYNDTEPLTLDDARALGRDASPPSGPDIF